MGRQVKRVPLDFDWPVGETWGGYLDPYRQFSKTCPTCDGTGGNRVTKIFGEWANCANCNGEGKVWKSRAWKDRSDAFSEASMEPPAGEGWQLWETVTSGSALTPVFRHPGQLAGYLHNHDVWGSSKTSTTDWLLWLTGPGWAPAFAVQACRR